MGIVLKYNKKPYKEGVLREIYELFIKPMIKAKPSNIHLNDWLDQIFCTDDRSILRYNAKKAFKMPGLFWLSPQKLVPGFGKRDIKVGREVWVRKDLTMPDRIDVEVTGQGKDQQIFALTRSEFDKISRHLVINEFRKNKRLKMSWEKP